MLDAEDDDAAVGEEAEVDAEVDGRFADGDAASEEEDEADEDEEPAVEVNADWLNAWLDR
jgi:hypothetical protein